MRVVLVRHGEACDAVVDAARPLTDAGRADVERLAQWCVEGRVAPTKILHSGILRAAQTAEILAARLAPKAGVRPARGLAPDDGPAPWLEELRHEPEPTMLVSHMPLVGELAALLAARRAPISFAPAAVMIFERDGGSFRVAASWRPDSAA